MRSLLWVSSCLSIGQALGPAGGTKQDGEGITVYRAGTGACPYNIQPSPPDP